MRRNENGVKVGCNRKLCLCPVEQRRQLPAIRKAGFGVSQLVEEAVGTGFQGRDSSSRRVLEEARDQRDGFHRRSGAEYLGPGVCFDLGKFEFGVVRIHFPDLFPSGRSQDFDDFH